MPFCKTCMHHERSIKEQVLDQSGRLGSGIWCTRSWIYAVAHVSALLDIFNTISILFDRAVFYFVLDGLPSIEHMTPQQKILDLAPDLTQCHHLISS